MLSTWLSTFQGVFSVEKCYKSIYKKLLPNNYNHAVYGCERSGVNLSRQGGGIYYLIGSRGIVTGRN